MKTAVEVEIEKMLKEGSRWNAIAKTVHVSKRTIAKVSKRMNEVVSEPPPVSEVFTMFEKGKTPMDIVKQYNADPEKILKWFEAWMKTSKDLKEKVFTMFEQNKSPTEIVKETNADPIILREWFQAWSELNKGYEERKQSEAEQTVAKDAERSKETPAKPPWKKEEMKRWFK